MVRMRSRLAPVVGRRRFLAAAGLVGGAAVAGCAGRGPDDGTGSTTGPPPTTTGTPSSTSPSSTDLTSLSPERRFDFLAGEWAVSDPAGDPVGTSVVRSHSGGNLLFEQWSGSDGSAAAAMTYYDFAADEWTHARVTDSGTIVEVAGGTVDGAMRLTGRRIRSDGTTQSVRLTYAATGDGTVDYRLETSTDGGSSWNPDVERSYERTGDAGPEPPSMAAPSENAGADPATLPPRRRFDFWVGTWDIHRPRGTVIVRNVIQSRLDGHLILENWDGAGLVGKSFNYWDPAGGQWVKRWVPDNGNKVVMTGGYRDDAMRLEGTLSYSYGSTVGHRASFTPEDDGTVTQRIQLSRDGGETWGSPWEGVHVRVEE